MALCPVIENFAGVFGKYNSSIFMALFGPPIPPPFSNSASKLSHFYYKVEIFFCNERIDFHLIYNFFPSGSISSTDALIYYANILAVFI